LPPFDSRVVADLEPGVDEHRLVEVGDGETTLRRQHLEEPPGHDAGAGRNLENSAWLELRQSQREISREWLE